MKLTLIVNQPVVFIDAEKKEHKGVIIEVVAQLPGGGGTARIDYTERSADGTAAKNKNESLGHHTAIAEYPEEAKPITFHFAPEKEAAAKTSGANGAAATPK